MGESAAEAALDYVKRGMSVIPLKSGKKSPATRNGLKDASNDYTVGEYFGKHPNQNIGIVCGPSNLLVFDIDVDTEKDKDGMEALVAWERENGELPDTWRALTPRGGVHIYYRYAGDDIKPSVSEELSIDIRAGESYVVAPPSKTATGSYIWEFDPEDYQLADADDHVLAFARYVQSKGKTSSDGDRFTVPAEIKSGERNETLFKAGRSMLAKCGGDMEIVLDYMRSVNRTRCKPPVSDAEIIKIYGSVCSKGAGYSDEVKSRMSTKGGTEATHSNPFGGLTAKSPEGLFSERVVEFAGLVRIDGVPAIWNGERYEVGNDAIDRFIIEHGRDIPRSKRVHIREDALLEAPMVSSAPPSLIAFKNGVIDAFSGDYELRPYSREDRIINVIPWDFEPYAKSDVLDGFLHDLACGDISVYNSLVQTIGLCLIRSCRFEKSPILLGSGSNGKSTYLKMLDNMLGKENVCHLSLRQCGDRFMAHHLAGKLANIGDDISNERIDGDTAERWKKASTGDKITGDVKNSRAIEFEPYATMVFSANDMPSLADSTDGMMRRLYPIPLDANFETGEKDRSMGDKLRTEEAVKAALWLGVQAIKVINDANGLFESERQKELVGRIEGDNNSVVQFVRETNLTSDRIENRRPSEVYGDYLQWIHDEGLMHPFSRTKFTRTITSKFGLETKPIRDESTSNLYRVFAKK